MPDRHLRYSQFHQPQFGMVYGIGFTSLLTKICVKTTYHMLLNKPFLEPTSVVQNQYSLHVSKSSGMWINLVWDKNTFSRWQAWSNVDEHANNIKQWIGKRCWDFSFTEILQRWNITINRTRLFCSVFQNVWIWAATHQLQQGILSWFKRQVCKLLKFHRWTHSSRSKKGTLAVVIFTTVKMIDEWSGSETRS